MSVITKIILDTAEYNRLLSIEKAYHELKAHLNTQSGSGKDCSCLNKNESSSTPPLSEIIAKNEVARSVDIPPRGILPSITDPNEKNEGQSTSTEKNSQSVQKAGQKLKRKHDINSFDTDNFRALANDKTNWYFLGHFEEK